MKKITALQLELIILIPFFTISLISLSFTLSINSVAYPQERPNKMLAKISSLTIQQIGPTGTLSGKYADIFCPVDISSTTPNTLKKVFLTKYDGRNDYPNFANNNENEHLSEKAIGGKLTPRVPYYVDHAGLIKPYSIRLQQYQRLSATINNYGNTPFEFPMPLGDLSSDNSMVLTHPKSKENGHLKDSLPSNTISTEGHSILKATLIPDNEVVKKMQVYSSKNSTHSTKKASPVLTNHYTAMGTSSNSSRNIYNLQFNGQNYPIIYHIAGNGNKLKSISVTKDNTTLLLNIASQSTGKLTIELPRNVIIDSKKQATNTNASFTVFEDGQYYTAFDDTKSSNKAGQLTIDFEKGTGQIEILASHTSPEFGITFTTAFELAIAFLIVAISRYNILSFIARQNMFRKGNLCK